MDRGSQGMRAESLEGLFSGLALLVLLNAHGPAFVGRTCLFCCMRRASPVRISANSALLASTPVPKERVAYLTLNVVRRSWPPKLPHMCGHPCFFYFHSKHVVWRARVALVLTGVPAPEPPWFA